MAEPERTTVPVDRGGVLTTMPDRPAGGGAAD
jgi:hypothetical protein